MAATLQTGDRGYVEQQFRLHEAALGRFLYGMVRDRALAEDLLQDTFVEACRTPQRLIEATSAEAWLFGVARHRALSAYRLQRRIAATTARLTGRHQPERYDDPGLAEALELLESLEPSTRALVLLRYVHGFQAAELAEICDRSPAALRKQLERARTHLQRRLVGEEITAT